MVKKVAVRRAALSPSGFRVEGEVFGKGCVRVSVFLLQQRVREKTRSE